LIIGIMFLLPLLFASKGQLSSGCAGALLGWFVALFVAAAVFRPNPWITGVGFFVGLIPGIAITGREARRGERRDASSDDDAER
jgi:F0F1-type ATP synthase assembly protein I